MIKYIILGILVVALIGCTAQTQVEVTQEPVVTGGEGAPLEDISYDYEDLLIDENTSVEIGEVI